MHFRPNPDFRYGNSVAIPVWNGDECKKYKDLKYIEDIDMNRIGFWIK